MVEIYIDVLLTGNNDVNNNLYLFCCRATTLVAFIDLCVAQKAETPKKDKKYSKYPPKVSYFILLRLFK